eukprot:IDg22540t1
MSTMFSKRTTKRIPKPRCGPTSNPAQIPRPSPSLFHLSVAPTLMHVCVANLKSAKTQRSTFILRKLQSSTIY